ncbi:MAG: hypothetical protein WCX74_00875 [Candidatus Paceibacterota bacterium]
MKNIISKKRKKMSDIKKLEKIYVTIFSFILIGLLGALGYVFFEKERSRNIEDIPLINFDTRNQPSDIEGEYFMNSQEGGYYQKLEIGKNTENLYRIAVRYGGSIKGCSFDAMGKLLNGKIEIPLGDVEPGLKQTMFIAFNGNKASISTSGEDKSELGNFCNNKGSLAGEYIKGQATK